ncbi:pyridine nucleotide-disulfide oxidoreductase [Streptomyces alboflavus]|uniref:Pyridine nucleotide-disulfide oxidoreductase n=1 Tax=Streptomyces alboflavus TaxID=67267 RepID=A0A1Z1WQN3_9ACTN|nr:pyridine nucleotide-disulfide oxidoreductase [Streptomyces alboflavus]
MIVVGGGASGTQHLMEIAPYAADTWWVTRRPPVFAEGPFDEDRGRSAVAMVEERVRQGLPPLSVVSVTGLPVNDAVRKAREDGVLDRLPMFDRITPTGVEWDDGRHVEADVILWATGFRAAIEHLAPLRLREPGGGIRMDGTRAAADPRVHLVGYGPSASTIGANRAGRGGAGDRAAAGGGARGRVKGYTSSSGGPCDRTPDGLWNPGFSVRRSPAALAAPATRRAARRRSRSRH